jgi:hypothetical protein
MTIKVHMEALAYITKKNPNAGIIMMMLLGRMNGDSVHISVTNLHNATGIDKGSLRRSIRWLKEGGYIDEDPEMDGFSIISPRMVPTEARPVFTYPRMKNRLPAFPRLEGPKVIKRVYTEIAYMNALTEEDVADAVFA